MSSILTHPDSVSYDTSKKLVKLFWNDKIEHKMAPPNGAEWDCRGGIQFPILTESGGLGSPRDVVGCGVMVGYCLKNRRYYVLNEASFSTIEHLIDPDTGGISMKGASSFFNDNWAKFYSDTYYWAGHPETSQKFVLQTIRSETIKPTPHLVEVSLGIVGQAQQLIFEKLQMGALVFRKAGIVHEGIQKYDSRSLAEMPASVHALTCALLGMSRSPWRMPPQEEA